MNDVFKPSQLILYGCGCLAVVLLPIVGIWALWNFEPSKLNEGFNNYVTTRDEQHDYNFSIEAGEDNILTDVIKVESKKIKIDPRKHKANILQIDSATIKGPIVYGNDGEQKLREGFWQYPGTAYPGEKGVSVIFGHRRYHLPPAEDTFYYLDKVQKGDRIEIKLSNGTWLEYTVVKTEVIDPSQLGEVLSSQSNKSIIKLVTCTPLGTDNQRLIITARKTF